MNNGRILVAGTSAILAGAAPARIVHESKDRSGPEFADKPATAASGVRLLLPNVIAMSAAPAATQASASAFACRNRIVAPEAQGTVHIISGAFDVRAR